MPGVRGIGGLAIKQSQKKHADREKAAARDRAHKAAAADRSSSGAKSIPIGPTLAPSTLADSGLDEVPDWIRLKPEGKGPRGHPVPIQVLRINVLQLQAIDQMAQNFMARMFIQLRIPHGAMDTDLVRDLDNPDPPFPADTLRPGAMWFLKQIDFPTSLEYSVLTEKVVKMKDHLDLVLKVSGTFFEQMELDDFPYDVQRLTVVLAFNAAKEGIVPIVFSDMSNAALSINRETFALSNSWILFPHVGVKRMTVDPMPNTTYPAIEMTSLVERRPLFVLTNVFLPMSVLTLLITLQFLMPGDFAYSGMRVTFSVTVLLTSATYKLFVSTTMPAVGYMTLCDRYLLVCFLMQASVVAEGAICGALVMERSETPDPPWLPAFATSLGDFVAFIACLAFFVLFHLYFIQQAFSQRRLKLSYELDYFAGSDAHVEASSDEAQTFTNYRNSLRTDTSPDQKPAKSEGRRRSVIGTLMGKQSALSA